MFSIGGGPTERRYWEHWKCLPRVEEGETFEWERESEKWQLQFRRFLGSPPKFFELHLIQKIVLSFHPLSITLGLLAWEFLGSDVLVQMLKMQGFRCENLHYLHSSKISNDIYLWKAILYIPAVISKRNMVCIYINTIWVFDMYGWVIYNFILYVFDIGQPYFCMRQIKALHFKAFVPGGWPH